MGGPQILDPPYSQPEDVELRETVNCNNSCKQQFSGLHNVVQPGARWRL